MHAIYECIHTASAVSPSFVVFWDAKKVKSFVLLARGMEWAVARELLTCTPAQQEPWVFSWQFLRVRVHAVCPMSTESGVAVPQDLTGFRNSAKNSDLGMGRNAWQRILDVEMQQEDFP